jgi:small subunit ribosomal protein S17e
LDLLEKYPDQFIANDYQHNKVTVGKMTTVESNLLRNRIAGYITRKLSSHKKEENQLNNE